MAMDRVEQNLDTVERHMAGEIGDPASIMGLYTDDVVFEAPDRGLRLTQKPDIEANYRKMFASVADLTLEPVSREATETRVEDIAVVRFMLVGNGFVNAPAPVGARVALRLHHVFDMRDGLIARETVHETWTVLEAPTKAKAELNASMGERS